MSWEHSKRFLMEHIGGALGVLFVIGLACLLSCCRTVRQSRSTRDSVAVHLVHKDSLVTNFIQKDSTLYRFTTKDSAVGIAGGSASLHLGASALDSGRVTKRQGNVTVRANKNADGSIDVDCATDSLTIVIEDLKSELLIKDREIAASSARVSVSDTTVKRDREVSETKVGGFQWNSFLLGSMCGLLLAVCVAMVLGQVFKGR